MNSMRFDFSFVSVRARVWSTFASLPPSFSLLRHMHPQTLFESFHTILYLTIFIKSLSLDLSTASAVTRREKKEQSLCYSSIIIICLVTFAANICPSSTFCLDCFFLFYFRFTSFFSYWLLVSDGFPFSSVFSSNFVFHL